MMAVERGLAEDCVGQKVFIHFLSQHRAPMTETELPLAAESCKSLIES